MTGRQDIHASGWCNVAGSHPVKVDNTRPAAGRGHGRRTADLSGGTGADDGWGDSQWRLLAWERAVDQDTTCEHAVHLEMVAIRFSTTHRARPDPSRPYPVSRLGENLVLVQHDWPLLLRVTQSGQEHTIHINLLVPLWVVLTLLAYRAIRRLHLRDLRRLQGLCNCCGYDLRATPLRCPEYGAETQANHPAQGI